MKVSEVPKDDANVLEGKTSFVQYAIDDKGHYVQEKSPGFQPQNIALEQAWEEVDENIAVAAELVERKEKSPIYFFMHREIMDAKILSEYVGISKWKVKRHFKPNIFAKLNDDILREYAVVFKLDNIDELKKFDINKWK